MRERARDPVPVVPVAPAARRILYTSRKVLRGHTLRRTLSSLDNTTFDVVIIGGGITGACLAHDATLRGLSVALIEQGDFGGATSSASSKLLHGGIRYLQQIRLDKVRESARERSYFQRIAPHLVRWVPFLVPTQAAFLRGRWLLACGMELYALLGGADEPVGATRAPSGTYLDRSELQREVPALAGCEGLTGAFVLNECHLFSSERMTLAFLKTAVAHGATVANYVSVDGLLREGTRVVGVRARDVERGGEFHIRARVTANAAGPWLTGLNDQFAVGALGRPVTGLAKGAHIVTRQLMPTYAAALPTGRASGSVVDRGGRHVFVIPWRGHSLIGTSNRRFQGHPDTVAPTEEDVADLLEDVNQALPSAVLTRGDVRHAFAGLYPLTARRIDPGVYQGTGDYQVIDHGRHGGAEGVVSALGAKYTTARRVAELATTVVCDKLGSLDGRCRTHDTPLVGGDVADVAALTREVGARRGDRLETATIESLVHHYGTEVNDVLGCAAEDPSALCRLSPDRETIEAEVVFAVEHEMSRQLADVVFRRTGLGTLGHPGEPCLERCAAIMGTRLAWSEEHRAEQLRLTRSLFQVAAA